MNKVIRGKRYDTDTATCVYTHCNSYYSNDFNYIEEILYRKRTGEYFMYIYGGANTKYAVSIGVNEWSGGEYIKPISIDKAKEWLEENADADTYEKEFGTVEESGYSTFNLSLPESLKAKVKNQAVKERKNMNEIIIDALNSYLD